VTIVTYLHLRAGQDPPSFHDLRPFKAVVIVEEEVTPAWRDLVSEKLVNAGCLYMMVWGHECSSWKLSVDIANLEVFEYKDIPEDQFVMTTSHTDEAIEEAFWYAQNLAFHSVVELNHTLILDISPVERGERLRLLFSKSIETQNQ
jgi:hypothetical protein